MSYKTPNPTLAHYRATRPARPMFLRGNPPAMHTKHPLWPLLVGGAIAGAFIVLACAQLLSYFG